MANRLNWSPGHEGKGNVYQSGDISTWNTDANGSPHHQEVAASDNSSLGFLFYITPEGGINDANIGFNSRMPMTDDQVIATIEQEDPYLFDGREGEPSVSESGPRVETGGGYGHAWNLINASVDKSNWPDCHAELKIPASVRRKLRKWVDRLKWPEGSEKDDARLYHITILSVEEYDDEFVDWMRERIRGRSFHFKSTGMALFGQENDIVVLRLECPEWRELAIEWGEEATERGLEPRRFPNGPRAHISIGKTPGGKWPQGVPDPHLEFDTSKFNVNKNSRVSADEEMNPVEELRQWLEAIPSPSTVPSGTIHHDDLDQMQPQTPSPASQGHFIDPPSHPYKPYDWATEGDYNQLDRTSALTRKQKLELLKRVESPEWAGGPDRSVVVHKFPNGWTMRELQTYGDAIREGELMGNCFSPLTMDPDSHHRLWWNHPEALWDEETMAPFAGGEGVYKGMPGGFDRSLPLDDRFMSLRDPDNIPHMSADDNEVFGTHNVEFQKTKPEYQKMWEDWETAETAKRGSPYRAQAKTSCFECGIDHPADEPCEEKQLAVPAADFKRSEADWYDRAWKEQGRARPFPEQPMHWRQDHAPDTSTA